MRRQPLRGHGGEEPPDRNVVRALTEDNEFLRGRASCHRVAMQALQGELTGLQGTREDLRMELDEARRNIHVVIKRRQESEHELVQEIELHRERAEILQANVKLLKERDQVSQTTSLQRFQERFRSVLQLRSDVDVDQGFSALVAELRSPCNFSPGIQQVLKESASHATVQKSRVALQEAQVEVQRAAKDGLETAVLARDSARLEHVSCLKHALAVELQTWSVEDVSAVYALSKEADARMSSVRRALDTARDRSNADKSLGELSETSTNAAYIVDNEPMHALAKYDKFASHCLGTLVSIKTASAINTFCKESRNLTFESEQAEGVGLLEGIRGPIKALEAAHMALTQEAEFWTQLNHIQNFPCATLLAAGWRELATRSDCANLFAVSAKRCRDLGSELVVEEDSLTTLADSCVSRIMGQTIVISS